MIIENEAMADMICTAITLGYIAKEEVKVNIQYTSDGDSAKNKEETDKHLKVMELFKQLGVSFNTTLAAPQSEMSYIIGKAGDATNVEKAKTYMEDCWKYLQDVTRDANKLTPPPKGAYIGGLSTADSKISIIGPSSIELYKPVYRDPDNAKVKVAYELAVDNTNAAINCLGSRKPATIKLSKCIIDFTDTNKQIPKEFKDGLLFKSYHGMIQAMIKYHGHMSPTKSDFCFELALGKGTSKVSSCMPCSMFMTSLGMPPTSTHLGRGDNWNIPGVNNDKLVSDCKTKQWYSNVKSYFEEGLGKISTSKSEPVQSLRTKVSKIDKEIIPLVFLEALTFEKAFTERIIQTLDRP